MVQRQIQWNFESEDHPERHHLTLLIINQRSKAEGILQKVHEVLQPTTDELIRTEGEISGTGLRYLLVTLDTFKKPTSNDLSKIYRGQIKRNTRDLYERQSPDGLPNYIDDNIRKLIS